VIISTVISRRRSPIGQAGRSTRSNRRVGVSGVRAAQQADVLSLLMGAARAVAGGDVRGGRGPAGIAITPAGAFTVGMAHAPNAVRLALAAPPVPVLAAALDRFAALGRGHAGR
jgi:hypothetical protein